MSEERPRAFSILYGWMWQPEGATSTITVERVATIDGRAILHVRALGNGQNPDYAPMIEITVSKGGRTLSVYEVRGDVRMKLLDALEGTDEEARR